MDDAFPVVVLVPAEMTARSIGPSGHAARHPAPHTATNDKRQSPARKERAELVDLRELCCISANNDKRSYDERRSNRSALERTGSNLWATRLEHFHDLRGPWYGDGQTQRGAVATNASIAQRAERNTTTVPRRSP